MLLTQARYLLITGDTAPGSFVTLEGRVVERLSVLLSRVLVLDAAIVDEEDPLFGVGYTQATLPSGLAEAIAYGVKTINAPQPSNIPAGVSGFSIDGAYSVQVASGQILTADGTPLSSRYAFAADLGGRCVTLALRYRSVAL